MEDRGLCGCARHECKLASSRRFETPVFCLKPLSTHVNDILERKNSVRRGKVRDESVR